MCRLPANSADSDLRPQRQIEKNQVWVKSRPLSLEPIVQLPHKPDMSKTSSNLNASFETLGRSASSPTAAPALGLLTKLFHGALLLSVLWQLLGVNFVELPSATQPGNLFFEIHEVIGLATLCLVLAFWFWSAVRRRGSPIAALLPWFSSQRRAAVMADINAHWAQLRQRQVPAPGAETPLASATHGLGLLTALGMGATGAWLYLQPVPGGLVLDAHKALSNLMWAYVIGHAGMAVAHEFTRHPVLKHMFGHEPDRTDQT